VGDATLVIGVGNRDRGDDGVGPAIADRVADLAGASLQVATSTADPSRLMDRWSGHDSVVIVDAVVDGHPAGTITVLDAIDQPLPTDVGSVSSHGFGVAAAVELARSLGRLPARLTVVGVSADHFDGDCLTGPVSQAVAVAATRVLEVAGA
jgi:hydrogenase maturation protease